MKLLPLLKSCAIPQNVLQHFLQCFSLNIKNVPAFFFILLISSIICFPCLYLTALYGIMQPNYDSNTSLLKVRSFEVGCFVCVFSRKWTDRRWRSSVCWTLEKSWSVTTLFNAPYACMDITDISCDNSRWFLCRTTPRKILPRKYHGRRMHGYAELFYDGTELLASRKRRRNSTLFSVAIWQPGCVGQKKIK